ncbi:nickel-responsive transcriptional regulator NikR [Variovorax sp. H27-G14]|uniref:nickel-responsive transcriptional regulator NikR n=1 Tax=Variovorax sp. H27-G14 TaxID=3111914 RepID=UPI0038FC35A3
MQRFTISLDDDLALQFDEFIANKGYVNRSEAVRDLIRSSLGSATLGQDEAPSKKRAKEKPWCVASVSYVYNHHEQTVASRVLGLQHDHHDLVITSLHTHLDHDNCMETVVLRGPTEAVRTCAEHLVALRGVRHGSVHLVPLDAGGHSHSHAHGAGDVHTHLKPRN